jgi:hypothetical protein
MGEYKVNYHGDEPVALDAIFLLKCQKKESEEAQFLHGHEASGFLASNL